MYGDSRMQNPCLQGPPGTNSLALPAFAITPPAVLIFGNPALFDVAALAKLGRCSSNPTATSDPIFIEVTNLPLRPMSSSQHVRAAWPSKPTCMAPSIRPTSPVLHPPRCQPCSLERVSCASRSQEGHTAGAAACKIGSPVARQRGSRGAVVSRASSL